MMCKSCRQEAEVFVKYDGVLSTTLCEKCADTTVEVAEDMNALHMTNMVVSKVAIDENSMNEWIVSKVMEQ